MEHWRLIAFAIFLAAVVAIGLVLLQRRRQAQRTGDDPIYGVASLDPEGIEQSPAAPRIRGVGKTGE